jgi:acyl-CoA thioester hydrolase
MKLFSEQIIPSPYPGSSFVRDEWLDLNGHMNMAHYVSAFDVGSCPLFDYLGLGWSYTADGVGSIFVGSSSLDYKNELLCGDPIRMETMILDFDGRRIHIYQKMYHEEKGFVAAEAEFLFLHVSLQTRKLTDIPVFSMLKLREVHAAHKPLSISRFVGRTIGLR